MGDITVNSDVRKALIKGSFDGNGFPMAFVKEIFLLECHVAGTGFRELAGIESNLVQGRILTFKRERDNVHDKLAIEIFDDLEQSLGYVPRQKNEVLARLMDAGKLVFGKIESVKRLNEWLRIDVRIYMRDV